MVIILFYFHGLKGCNLETKNSVIYGGPYLPRQNLLFHGKTYFFTAKLTFPRQNLLFHGKTYFFTAKLTFPRQNILFHGKTFFSTAKLTFSYFRNPVSLGLQFRAILDPGTSDCTPADPTWRIRKKISCKYVKT